MDALAPRHGCTSGIARAVHSIGTCHALAKHTQPLGRCIAAAAAASGSTRADLLDLTQWALSNGVKYAKVRPEQLPNGRGMVATFPIAAGEALVSVPAAAAVRVTAQDSPPPALAALQPRWQSLPWYIKLACRLAAEAQQGKASMLATPIAALPTASDIDLPVNWAQPDIQQLQCPHMIKLVQEQQQEWGSWCQQLSGALSAAGISRDTFRWALAITRSRTFAAPDPPFPLSTLVTAAAAVQVAVVGTALAVGTTAAAVAEGFGLAAVAGAGVWVLQQAQAQQQHVLAPLIDMFNHDPSVQSCCELDIWSGSFKVVASRAWSPKQQVTINYGPSSNDALLQLYGFVLPDNPDDRYVLEDVPSKLQQLGLASTTTITSSRSSPQFQLVLQQQGLQADGAAALHQQLGLAPPSSSSSSSSSNGGLVAYSTCHPQVQAAVARLIALEQQQLGSSLQDDTALLEGIARLPAAQQQLQQVTSNGERIRNEVEAVRSQVALIEQQQAVQEAATGVAEDLLTASSGGEAAAAAATAAVTTTATTTAAVPPEAVYAMLAEERRLQQQLRQALQQQQDLEAEIAGLLEKTDGVKLTAVQYRVQKKKLLAEVQAQLSS